MEKKNLTVAEIEEFANEQFTSYEGEGDYGYTGEGDDSMDFGGNGTNWFNSDERSFTYKITNANASARTAFILPGILWAVGKIAGVTSTIADTTITNTLVYPNGFVRDGAFNDKNGYSGLTGESTDSNKTIEEFFAFVYASPCAINKIRIKTSDSSGAQLDNKITVRHQSPFRDMGTVSLTPSDVQDQATQQKDVAMFYTPGFVAAKDVQAELSIAGSQSTTITFYIGPIKNTTSEIKKKAARAGATAIALKNEALIKR